MKEEGVPVFRSRFGFTRPATSAVTAKVQNNSNNANVSHRSFLKKIEYFDTNKSVEPKSYKPKNSLKKTIKDGNKNQDNASEVLIQNELNLNKTHKVHSPKSKQKNSPKKLLKIQNENVETSQLRKPLFVTKYSAYRSDIVQQKQSVPLIMTAGSSRSPFHTKENCIKSSPESMSKSSKIPERKIEFVTSTPRPSQLPGLRSSFLSSNKSQLTSASLHHRGYGYNFSGSPIIPSDKKSEVNPKSTPRNFVKYKINVADKKEVNTAADRTRKWVAKRQTQSLDNSQSASKELESLNKLKASNKMILEGQKTQKKANFGASPGALQTISQEGELNLSDDCLGAATETEEDSGIFTSSNSKYSIDDEMVENDASTNPSDKKQTLESTNNFGSDSDDICSRETSPMQLLADMLRKGTDVNDDVDGKDSVPGIQPKGSLVKLRRLQFEQRSSPEKDVKSSLNLTRLQEVTEIDEAIDGKQTNKTSKALDTSPDDKMVSSMVSNTSRLSICTDCTAASEENENKFFDDDYTDQQQLIISNHEETDYNDPIFSRVDSLLQSKKEEQEKEEDQDIYHHNKCVVHDYAPVQRIQQIIREDYSSEQHKRKTSVDTLSSLDSDVCMLDFDEKHESDDSVCNSRASSPVKLFSDQTSIMNDVKNIKDLLLNLQAFLSHDDIMKEKKIQQENEDLKMQISVLKLKLAEKDRKIETLQRRIEQKHSFSLSRLNNIATQTTRESGSNSKSRPLSWELSSYSLLKNI